LGIVQQFFSFAGVGLVGTAVHYSALFLLVNFTAVEIIIASSLGFVLGALVNYYLNYYFVFRSQSYHRHTLPKFMAVAAVGFLLNGVLMWLTILQWQWHYLLGQLVATGGVLIWNFLGNHMWTFGDR